MQAQKTRRGAGSEVEVVCFSTPSPTQSPSLAPSPFSPNSPSSSSAASSPSSYASASPSKLRHILSTVLSASSKDDDESDNETSLAFRSERGGSGSEMQPSGPPSSIRTRRGSSMGRSPASMVRQASFDFDVHATETTRSSLGTARNARKMHSAPSSPVVAADGLASEAETAAAATTGVWGGLAAEQNTSLSPLPSPALSTVAVTLNEANSSGYGVGGGPANSSGCGVGGGPLRHSHPRKTSTSLDELPSAVVNTAAPEALTADVSSATGSSSGSTTDGGECCGEEGGSRLHSSSVLLATPKSGQSRATSSKKETGEDLVRRFGSFDAGIGTPSSLFSRSKSCCMELEEDGASGSSMHQTSSTSLSSPALSSLSSSSFSSAPATPLSSVLPGSSSGGGGGGRWRRASNESLSSSSSAQRPSNYPWESCMKSFPNNQLEKFRAKHLGVMAEETKEKARRSREWEDREALRVKNLAPTSTSCTTVISSTPLTAAAVVSTAVDINENNEEEKEKEEKEENSSSPRQQLTTPSPPPVAAALSSLSPLPASALPSSSSLLSSSYPLDLAGVVKAVPLAAAAAAAAAIAVAAGSSSRPVVEHGGSSGISCCGGENDDDSAAANSLVQFRTKGLVRSSSSPPRVDEEGVFPAVFGALPSQLLFVGDGGGGGGEVAEEAVAVESPHATVHRPAKPSLSHPVVLQHKTTMDDDSDDGDEDEAKVVDDPFEDDKALSETREEKESDDDDDDDDGGDVYEYSCEEYSTRSSTSSGSPRPSMTSGGLLGGVSASYDQEQEQGRPSRHAAAAGAGVTGSASQATVHSPSRPSRAIKPADEATQITTAITATSEVSFSSLEPAREEEEERKAAERIRQTRITTSHPLKSSYTTRNPIAHDVESHNDLLPVSRSRRRDSLSRMLLNPGGGGAAHLLSPEEEQAAARTTAAGGIGNLPRERRKIEL